MALAIFVLGQLAAKFFIIPAHRQIEEIGRIADSLDFYANIYSDPRLISQDKVREVGQVLRTHATRLSSFTVIIPWYGIWERLRLLRKRENIKRATGLLISLSNYVQSSHFSPDDVVRVYNSAKEIKSLLKIEL